MSPLPPNTTLTPATEADIPALVTLGNLAFLGDTHTQLKEGVKKRPVFDDGYSSHLASLISHPRAKLIVARDVPSGQAVGFVAWASRNLDDSSATTTTIWGAPPEPPALPEHSPLTVADLEALTNASMADWQRYFCPDGVRCRYLIGLSVHPDFHGRGIGRALLRWGTDKCDAEGMYAWVQGSMGSKGMYERCGFREVGRLDLDLDLFSGGHKSGAEDGRWGRYVWPYMRREPVGDGEVCGLGAAARAGS